MIFSDKKLLAEFLTLNYADDADFCKPTQPCCHHFEVQCRYVELVHRRLVLYVRVLVSVGAVGAVAPTDFQKDWFCTHRF